VNTANNSVRIPVIVIFAPTASGKTALTRELFSKTGSHFILNGEIISADSQAVYKMMDIGTAKPTKDFCSQIPHHLIDVVTPDVQFNVSDFVTLADKACEDIYSRGKIPVVCGGTGFYVRNFLFGLPKTPESSEIVRKQIQERLKIQGKEVLYTELKAIDPVSAEKIHPNDEYRICRALEVYYTTGKTRSSYELDVNLRDKYDFLFLVLEPPKDQLVSRINSRVDEMFHLGLEEEVEKLLKAGYTKDCPGLKAIGYSEFFQFDDKEIISEKIKHNSFKYAKKQFTYIRDIPGSKIIPFSATDDDVKKVGELIKNFVSGLDLYQRFCDNDNTL